MSISINFYLKSPTPSIFGSRQTFSPEKCELYGNPVELHMIILWSNARYKQEQILNDIKKTHLTILECFDISWPKKVVANNYTMLYTFSKAAGIQKEKDSGSDNFLIIMVLDKFPKYSMEKSPSGSLECNNQLLYQLKHKYRRWTGIDKYAIHATSSPAETDHDLRLLLGISYDDYLKNAPQHWNGKIKYLTPTLEFEKENH